MKISQAVILTLNLALAALLGVLAGCASTGYDKATATGTALQATAQQVSLGSAQLTETMAFLNNLVERPQADLRPQFEKFSTALDQLQALAKDVNDKATDMQAKGQDYFKAWDQQLATIKNEDIRTRSAKRQQEVAAKFQTMNGDYQEAKTAFKPLMSNLQDIKTYLSNDLTANGIASIKKTVAQANQEVPPLKKAVGKLSADFKSLGLAMSAVTPAPK